MMENSTIRLLTSTNNARSDLFARLTRDLFFTIGYDELRLDVHKSGQELDVQDIHRLEPRRLVAECKAHAKKMGGEALNKFFGAFTRERKRHKPEPVTGYFVSRSGFTETAIEQEIETGDDRVILFDARRVIDGRTQQIDADHDGEVKKGFVAESWIVRQGDPLFAEEPEGAWVVGIKVIDEATWKPCYRREDWVTYRTDETTPPSPETPKEGGVLLGYSLLSSDPGC